MEKRGIFWIFGVGILLLLSAGCGDRGLDNSLDKNLDKGGETVKLSNSVSQYCEDNGGTSEFTELPDGNELGTCFFVDGSFCDVWDYKDGNCKRGDNPVVVAGSDAKKV